VVPSRAWASGNGRTRGGVLLGFVEDLAAIEQGRGIVRVEGEGLLEGFERAVGVAADRDDEAEVGHGVDVLGLALEDGLVRGDRFAVAALEEARARGLEHALKDLGGDRAWGPGAARRHRAGASARRRLERRQRA